MNCCPICHNEIAEGDVTRVKVTLPNGDYYSMIWTPIVCA